MKNFGTKNYRDIVQKSEIAEAVELLGCYFVDKKRDFSKGVDMWIWALMIRGEGKIKITAGCIIVLSMKIHFKTDVVCRPI